MKIIKNLFVVNIILLITSVFCISIIYFFLLNPNSGSLIKKLSNTINQKKNEIEFIKDFEVLKQNYLKVIDVLESVKDTLEASTDVIIGLLIMILILSIFNCCYLIVLRKKHLTTNSSLS